jgi:hypothetical protein
VEKKKMRKPLVLCIGVALSGAAACGGDSTAPPPDAWVGTWTLTRVNGSLLPADITIYGYPAHVFSRTLVIDSSGSGSWRDSTLSGSFCVPQSTTTLCNGSGFALLDWAVRDDGLTAELRAGSVEGIVISPERFVRQADGTLLKTEDGQVEVYQRR